MSEDPRRALLWVATNFQFHLRVVQSGSTTGLGPAGRRFKSCLGDHFHRRLPELVYWAGLENQWGIHVPPSVRIGHLLPGRHGRIGQGSILLRCRSLKWLLEVRVFLSPPSISISNKVIGCSYHQYGQVPSSTEIQPDGKRGGRASSSETLGSKLLLTDNFQLL